MISFPAEDSRITTADLSRLIAEAREIERDGTATGATQRVLVALMEE